MLRCDVCALQLIVAERGPLLFVFNFSPFNDYEGYKARLFHQFLPCYFSVPARAEVPKAAHDKTAAEGELFWGCHAGGHSRAGQVQGGAVIR